MTIGINADIRNSRLQLILDAIGDGADEYGLVNYNYIQEQDLQQVDQSGLVFF